MQKHVLVTGGAGFIGSHLVDALVLRGFRVTVLDIKKQNENPFMVPQADYIQADLTDPNSIDIVRALAPDIIYHFAANASVAKSVEDPIMDMDINYLASVRLMDVAADLGVEAFVFASTGGALSSEYGQLPTPEHAACKPLSPYAMHKLASEQMGEFYRVNRGLRFVALRFANVYGPRQTVTCGEANVIATFARKLVAGEAASINGSGRQTRDYVYVDDVVDACLRVLDASHATGAFNVGSGIEVDVLTLHRLMSSYVGSVAFPVMRVAQAGEPMRSCLDVSKIADQLAWKPRISLAEGLARTIDWHRAQLDVVQPVESALMQPAI